MPRLGWVLFGLTCLCAALQVALLLASNVPVWSYDTIVGQSFPLTTIGAVVGAAVGAVIVSRYPQNKVGWFFCVGQLGTAVGLTASCYLLATATGGIDGALPLWPMQLLSQCFNALYAMAFLALIFLYVPEGDLPSPRWRLAPYVPVAAVLLQAAVIIGIPSEDFVPGASPVFGWHTVALILLSDVALAVAILLGAIAVWRRLRAADGERRRQLLWIAASATALTITYVLALVVGVFSVVKPWYVAVPWHASYLFVSVAVGVAILRYRLYDIDVILSRAIVLGVLAVFVTAGYVVVVVAVGSVLTAIGESGSTGYWPSLIATALVAAAFQPIRRHVLRLADQLVYGNRAVPYEALAVLGRRLADSPSPDALPARVAEATGRAVGAAQTVVELGQPGSGTPVLTAYWPDPDADPAANPVVVHQATGQSLTLPVRDLDEQIGTIDVVMPAGRDLRPFERRLLADAAAQAGVAFRNALLEAELAAQVGQIESRSAELAASRRRLVGVEDEAREQLAGAIQRGVVPHLTTVEAELGRGGPDLDLVRLIDETQCALEELRAVCRGVFPALLERRGLVPALSAHLQASCPQAVLDVDESAQRRVNKEAEAAAYLFCVEVTPPDRPCVITLRVAGGRLLVTIDVPDAQLADSAFDGAWQHGRDRVAALDGAVRVRREPSGSVKVRAVIPSVVHRDREAAMSAQTSSSRSGPNADLGTYADAPQSSVRSANSASS